MSSLNKLRIAGTIPPMWYRWFTEDIDWATKRRCGLCERKIQVGDHFINVEKGPRAGQHLCVSCAPDDPEGLADHLATRVEGALR